MLVLRCIDLTVKSNGSYGVVFYEQKIECQLCRCLFFALCAKELLLQSAVQKQSKVCTSPMIKVHHMIVTNF